MLKTREAAAQLLNINILASAMLMSKSDQQDTDKLNALFADLGKLVYGGTAPDKAKSDAMTILAREATKVYKITVPEWYEDADKPKKAVKRKFTRVPGAKNLDSKEEK